MESFAHAGGLVLYSHFLEGVQHHPIGHPSHPNDYMERGELRALFAGWEVLLDDEEACLPDGRPMVAFLARKPQPQPLTATADADVEAPPGVLPGGAGGDGAAPTTGQGRECVAT